MKVDQTFSCVQCDNGFVLTPSSTCIRQVANCIIYNSTSCSACNDGFFLARGQCEKFPSFCSLVDSEGKCLICQAPTTKYNGRCVYYQTFCLAYNIRGNCTDVPRDFQLNSVGQVISNVALSWDLNGNLISCRSGFTLLNNNCVWLVDNCASYTQMSDCGSCTSNYYLNVSQCVNTSGVCITPSPDGKSCLLCSTDFGLVNGTCFGRRNFGKTFDSVGYPITLQAGYGLTEQRVGMPLGYNCAKQNFSNGQCIDCANYYTMVNNTCIVND